MRTDAEIDRIDEQVRLELPEILERQKRQKIAVQEQSVSGQLRRAIIQSGLLYPEVCRLSGLTLIELDEFMTGEPVPATVINALANALHYSLTHCRA